ncbi:RNA methyltransferase [Candidatus Peregrinibacteria bacterium]|nr:RNA methyltransferase [Candidatus Peregrinibacteria bacterium]
MRATRSIILVAHNIRSLWNVGALFRTSDCFAIEKLILSGYTATPERREISKTAIGAEQWIPWEACDDPLALLGEYRDKGWRIVALEQSERSTVLSDYRPADKTLLVVGHEVLGVPKELLQLCDDVIAIPMHGRKESLNVSVAAGIALHHLRNS